MLAIGFEVRGGELLEAQTWLTVRYGGGDEGPITEEGGRLEHLVTRWPVGTLACTMQTKHLVLDVTAADLARVRKVPSPLVFP